MKTSDFINKSNLIFLLFFCLSLFVLKENNISIASSSESLFLRLTDINNLSDIAEKRISSVVNISSATLIKSKKQKQLTPFFNDPFFHNFFDVLKDQREKSLGSGVIVSKDGLILTNSHIIQNIEEIIVTTIDKQKFEADIVGIDPDSNIAVIQMKGYFKGLQPIPIGNSAELRLGEIIIAIGNPFGFEHTVSMGIISAKGRTNIGIADYEDFIQTDAAINPGNSGGALINLKGELVGINTAIMSRFGGYQGIGFAVPSNMANVVMKSIVKYGKVIRGWLGVIVDNLDNDSSESIGLPRINGVVVSKVLKGSPAEEVGLQREDIILKVNDEEINDASRLYNFIAAMGDGVDVNLEIIRKQKKKNIVVTLAKSPETLGSQGYMKRNEDILGGINIVPLNKKNRKMYNIPSAVKHGVIITYIEQNIQLHYTNLKQGDVIMEINRKNVNSIIDIKKEYEKSDRKVLMLIYRDKNIFYLQLKK